MPHTGKPVGKAGFATPNVEAQRHLTQTIACGGAQAAGSNVRWSDQLYLAARH